MKSAWEEAPQLIVTWLALVGFKMQASLVLVQKKYMNYREKLNTVFFS